MRRASGIVFDEYVSGPNVHSYTSDKFDDLLGKYDQLSIQLVVNDVNQAGSITLSSLHSADGIHFIPKATLISNAPILFGQTTTIGAVDAGTTPSLTYVRLQIFLTTAHNAHVKAYFVARDEGIADVVARPSKPHQRQVVHERGRPERQGQHRSREG